MVKPYSLLPFIILNFYYQATESFVGNNGFGMTKRRTPSLIGNFFLDDTNTLSKTTTSKSNLVLFGKKKKGGGGGGGNYKTNRGQQPQQEKASVKEARFDAATRQFMFTMVKLSKILPDKSKKILNNINLSFYPGAKIGVVGLNGSGKSSLLKVCRKPCGSLIFPFLYLLFLVILLA